MNTSNLLDDKYDSRVNMPNNANLDEPFCQTWRKEMSGDDGNCNGSFMKSWLDSF